MIAPPSLRCGECGGEIAPGLLSCPSCGRLVHSQTLQNLAQRAAMAERIGEWSAALAAWREAVGYLPPGTRQRSEVEAKIAALSRQTGAGGQPGQPWWKRAKALGPVGVAAAVLGKAKFLLLGFSKLGTLLSFLVSLSVYWALWGWKFALGFLLSIYVHEMGHVAALHRFGVPASAPTFIPGFGAFVRLKQHPASAREDARVGIGGPVWGLFASLAAYGLFIATGNGLFAAVARAGAWVNLFNLIPVWQLDGSRAIRSLNKMQIWMLTVTAAGCWFVFQEGMVLLVALVLAFRAYTKRDVPEDEDWSGFAQFAGLIVAFSLLAQIPGATR